MKGHKRLQSGDMNYLTFLLKADLDTIFLKLINNTSDLLAQQVDVLDFEKLSNSTHPHPLQH